MTEFANNENLLDSLDFIVQGLVSKESVIYVVEEKPLLPSLDRCLHGLEPKEPTINFIIEEILSHGL